MFNHIVESQPYNKIGVVINIMIMMIMTIIIFEAIVYRGVNKMH